MLTWLRLLHKDLPALIKQRYGPELRHRSLASIKPEISQALPALLSELKLTEDVRSLSISQPHPGLLPRNGPPKGPLRGNRRSMRICPLCQQARRDHLLSACPFLPESDRRFMLRARTLGVEEDDNTDEYNFKDDDYYMHEDTTLEVFHTSIPERSRLSRVSVRRSPILNAVSGNKTPVMILLDIGAECSFIRIEEAQRLGVHVDKNTSQRPSMADGINSLHVLGETHINFLCHGNKLHMDTIVVDTLASPIVAGMSFMEDHGIDINGRSRTITLPDSTSLKYDSPQVNNKPRLGRILIRSESKSSTWWPNEAVYLKPPKVQPGDELLLDPRHDCDPSVARVLKPTMAVVAEDNTVALFPNLDGPITVPRYSHLFNVRRSVPVDSPELQEVLMSPYKAPVVMATTPTEHPVDTVRIDPDNILPQQDKALLWEITLRFPSVFKPDFKGYNGAMGPFQAVVNIGPSLPPQRKGRVPQYSHDNLVLLQEKLDQLEEAGIIAKPEMVGISVEHLNPSFLVTKPNGGHRLVTAFSEVAKYCKPQPSLMPDVNNTLRIISKWKYLIVTDLTSAFHQIPLSRKSQKFCGIVTPFKGVRVYQRCAMGMPGSETALEELIRPTPSPHAYSRQPPLTWSPLLDLSRRSQELSRDVPLFWAPWRMPSRTLNQKSRWYGRMQPPVPSRTYRRQWSVGWPSNSQPHQMSCG